MIEGLMECMKNAIVGVTFELSAQGWPGPVRVWTAPIRAYPGLILAPVSSKLRPGVYPAPALSGLEKRENNFRYFASTKRHTLS